MSTISVKMPDAMGVCLEYEAQRRKTSKSELIRYCIDQVLSKKVVKEPPSFYELSQDMCGKQKGGATDLSFNPKHLEGFGK